MDLFVNVYVLIINSFIITAAMTNLLLYPIKFRYRCLIFILLACVQIHLSDYGQLISIICIGGALIIVALASKNRISNITFAAFGYMLQVFINHFIHIPLNIMGITISQVSNDNIYSLIFVTFFAVITFTSTLFLGRYLKAILPEYTDTFPLSIQILFMIEVLASTTVFIMNIIRGDLYGYPQSVVYYNGIIFGVFFFLTFVILFLCLYIMRKNSELVRIQKEDEQLLQYMEKVESMYQEMRIFKHDYLNILSTLSNYIIEDDMPSLKQYFQHEILPDSEKLANQDSLLAKLSNIKIRELKGLLYSKLVAALNLDLSVTLEIHNELDYLPMKILDLCKVLGVFLDNALEAATEYGSGQIVVAVIDNETHIAVIISNSTCTENINLQKIYNKEYSTKPGHGGIGLYAAKDIISQYDNVTHSTLSRNFLFTQTLHIYKNQY